MTKETSELCLNLNFYAPLSLNITIILANVSNFGQITHAEKLQVLDVVVLHKEEILCLINHLYSNKIPSAWFPVCSRPC